MPPEVMKSDPYKGMSQILIRNDKYMESGDFKVGRPHESATALFLVGTPPPKSGAKLAPQP